MPEKQTDSIVYWIRSDLRLSDNIALWEAAKSNKNLIVVYIKNLTSGSSKTGSAADTWINKSLLKFKLILSMITIMLWDRFLLCLILMMLNKLSYSSLC